ncbi:MAG: ABC transporter permease [Deltaproteobacteria bacterium]|nr:ABC transporter permease [Deltaproteobacteria bacterium]
MTAYLIRRLLLMIPTFFGITVITFVIIHLTPGDPVKLKMQQEGGGMKPGVVATEVIEQTRKLYGLDQPLYVQYGRWLRRIVTLDFGNSFQDERPILRKIAEALPITLLLNLIAICIIYCIAIPTGVWNALRAGGLWDQGTAVLFYILYSLPAFWVASLLLIFFAGGDYLNWFPIVGFISEGAEQLSWWQRAGNVLWHLVLPIICMTYGGFAFLSRFSRSVMLDVVKQDYMRTARAKGLSEWRVIVRHGFRNALIPFVTLFGTLLPGMLGGSIIIEQIFSVPGMGRLSFEAVMARDYPLVMALATIDSLLTLIGLLLSDLLYAVVDPRVSYE